MKSAAVIQAAGKGSRFHTDQYKLLADVGGVPMILRTLETVLLSGFDEIVIVIGSHAEEMQRLLLDYPVNIIINNNWELGQSTSLSAGVQAVRNSSDRACLLLGDQPFLQPETIRSLLAESDRYPEKIIVPFYQNKRGNPIIVPSLFYDELLELTIGDEGGRQLLRAVGFHEFSVGDQGILRDIDTVEDLYSSIMAGTYKKTGNRI